MLQTGSYSFPDNTTAMDFSAAHAMLSLRESMQHLQPETPNYHQVADRFEKRFEFSSPISQQSRLQSQTEVPLTPPGSPDDEGNALTIVDRSPMRQPDSTTGSAMKHPLALVKPAPVSIAIPVGNGQNGFGLDSSSMIRNLLSASAAASQAYFSGGDQQMAGISNPDSGNNGNQTMLSPNLGSFSGLFDNQLIARALGPSATPVIPFQRGGLGIGGSRNRSTKKPIPNDLKDEKYFERRRKNNEAAKKSRDIRKYREDEISIRAVNLEKENHYLRAQITTLREVIRGVKG